MEMIRKFFASKGVGYYLSLLGLACGIAALVLYYQTGITDFSPSLDTSAIVSCWIFMALCLVSLVLDFKEVRYVAYLVGLYAFMAYVGSQATYIANIFVSIDGSVFSAGFIATAVFFVLAFVIMLVAALMTKWQPWKKEGGSDV